MAALSVAALVCPFFDSRQPDGSCHALYWAVLFVNRCNWAFKQDA